MDIAALEKIQDRILDTLEKRFLSHEGIIFDYVGLDGKVILPTPEECKKINPTPSLGTHLSKTVPFLMATSSLPYYAVGKNAIPNA